jgi:uncharacterized membrane protein YhfC
MIALPILLGIILAHKFHISWRIWLIGAFTFIISQIFHLPFNRYILNPLLVNIQKALPEVSALIIIAVLLGLSAGIFEECSRYGMYRWWLKNNRSWRNGIMAGAGHGGMESIILGVLVMLTYFNLMAYRNIDLSNLNLPAEQLAIARQQIQLYWSLPWYDSLLGALERALTIPFHIAASVLVLQVFTRKPGHQALLWLVLAILYHAAMDAAVVFINSEWGTYAAEAFLGLTVVLDIVIIFALRQPEPKSNGPLQLPGINEPPIFTPTPVEETSDNLEKTRYQ